MDEIVVGAVSAIASGAGVVVEGVLKAVVVDGGLASVSGTVVG